jgi:hypothetical protein
VKDELPQRLAHLHGQDPGSVAIFHSMFSGSDELVHEIGKQEGELAAARHMLERGNEILKDFANAGREEFRMSMAYQKFEERSNQMRQVLRCVLQPNCSDAVELSDGTAGCAEGSQKAAEGPGSDGQHPPATAAAPLRVLSLGGGSGNDAVGVVAFLMERNASCGIVPSAVPVPRGAVEPQGPTKLTWAEKKAAKKAGLDVKKLQAEAAAVAPEDFRFASDMLRLAAVKAPAVSRFPACPSVQCHVMDIDEKWYESVGTSVQRAADSYFGAGGAGGAGGAVDGEGSSLGGAGESGSAAAAVKAEAVPFAQLHWHRCDVTVPLCGAYPHLRQAAPAADAAALPSGSNPARPLHDAAASVPPCGVALVVTSYLFTVHMGLPDGHSGRLAPETAARTSEGELPVSPEFWSALLAANPDAWCVFVEGWVSKKTWGALFEVFAQAGRVLSIPQKVTGELPQRVVIPSKRRPHAIREKDRNYCYWFSPPPAAPPAPRGAPPRAEA